ncbi:hypothetical protein AGMMS49991_10650 [Spirochaetia bacterium]|nr:hypothetical protein AGMMS49991_10650 [Spirochaetia bacterium]
MRKRIPAPPVSLPCGIAAGCITTILTLAVFLLVSCSKNTPAEPMIWE